MQPVHASPPHTTTQLLSTEGEGSEEHTCPLHASRASHGVRGHVQKENVGPLAQKHSEI